MMDELKSQMLELIGIMGSDEVVEGIAEANWKVLCALQRRGFKREEAMQLVVAQARGKKS